MRKRCIDQGRGIRDQGTEVPASDGVAAVNERVQFVSLHIYAAFRRSGGSLTQIWAVSPLFGCSVYCSSNQFVKFSRPPFNSMQQSFGSFGQHTENGENSTIHETSHKTGFRNST